MICGTIAIDMTFNITSIFFTTSLPRKQQGLAGTLINSLMHLGIAFFLGLADVVVTNTAHLSQRGSHKSVFWCEVWCAGLALFSLAEFVKDR
jgi:hypothetical protein